MSRITREQVERIAYLARLRLSEGETEAMIGHLDRILDYVGELSEISTEGVEPTSHVLRLATPLRDDRPAPSLPPEVVVRSAPRSCGSAFEVPTALEGEEEA